MMLGNISSQNTGLNISAINRSLANKQEAITGKKQEESAVMVSISPAGKRQNMITQLMKQKQYLAEQMTSISAAAEESGLDIQDQMKEYQKQMDVLDEQIAQLQTQQDEGKEKDQEEPYIYDKPKTKEEAESQKMNDLMSLATSSDHAEVITSSKNQIDGRINVLESEIKTGNGNIEAKQSELAELNQKSNNLNEQLGEQIAETVGKTGDASKVNAEIELTEEDVDVTENPLEIQSDK